MTSRTASEHQIQAAVVQWRDAMEAQIPELHWLHAVPNGAKLPFRKRVSSSGRVTRVSNEAIKLKREGMVSGVMDMYWPMPRGNHHGLYIEHKAGRNTLTDEQKAFKEHLLRNGYCCVVSRDPETSIIAVQRYWHLGPFDPSGNGMILVTIDDCLPRKQPAKRAEAKRPKRAGSTRPSKG